MWKIVFRFAGIKNLKQEVMENTRVHTRRREIEVSINGNLILFQPFGNEIICLNPPYGLNKESYQYQNLKKVLVNLEYFAQKETKYPKKFDVRTAQKVLKQLKL